MPQWNVLLKTLGFNESESALYLAGLELGPSPVQALAKKAEISRVTAYGALDSLIEKGLVSSAENGKKKLFAAESPERLFALVHTQMKTMETTLREAEAAVDELKLLQHGEKPVVKVFEGHEALHAFQNDILSKRPDVIYEFGNMDEILRLYSRDNDLRPFQEKLQDFNPQRFAYLLADNQKLLSSTPRLEVTGLPNEPGRNFTGDICVYGNTVALSTFRGKQISVLIQSTELAETMRVLFSYLREALQKRKGPSDA